MIATPTAFDEPSLAVRLPDLSDVELDELDFGVIGFDDETRVRLYTAAESRMAGLSPARVLGLPLFDVVAPCMNNYLVAQRFADARAQGTSLDVVVDYVLTLRMKPVKVKLRLIAVPGAAMRYMLVDRRASVPS